jgi:hypothetical protein
MADHDFAAVSDALEQRVREHLEHQPNHATVALNLATITSGSGKNIGMDVTVGTDQAAEVADGADISTFNTDTEAMATQGWTILNDSFAVTGLAEAAAAGEPNALRNTPLLKLIQSGMRLASKANQRYIAGTGAGSPAQALGITTVGGALDDTGTYMSIDRSAEAQWQGNVDGNSGTPRTLTLALIDGILDSAYVASGKVPEYGICTPTVWRAIANLHRDKERYMKEVTVKGQDIVLPGGQRAIEHDGIPIFKDKDWLANSLGFMNSQHVGCEFLPAPDFGDGDTIAMFPIAGTPQEQAGTARESRGLMAKLVRLGKTGDKRKMALYLYWNTWCNRPNATGLLKDVEP